MEELSLHILDIAENSVSAGATVIEITVEINESDDLLIITIKDNGKGMNSELLSRVTDPFTTTRTTRKAGLGIPLFKAIALQCEGEFNIESTEFVGTTVTAKFKFSNIDTPPLGDISGTVMTLISGSPEIRFVYTHILNDKSFNFDTSEIKSTLGDVPISNPEILLWIKDYISENIKCL